jgi:hypothetical protein
MASPATAPTAMPAIAPAPSLLGRCTPGPELEPVVDVVVADESVFDTLDDSLPNIPCLSDRKYPY